MIKKIGIIAVLAGIICSLCACGIQSSNTNGSNNNESSSSENSSEKKKYKSINADTNPVGIDNISIKMDSQYPYLFCKIHKNGGDIEESIIEVAFEITNENDEYIGKMAVKTERSLSVGESETVKETVKDGFYSIIPQDKCSDEFLSKYKATVVSINEIDAKKAEEQEKLEAIMDEIESKIKYREEYNSALAMLEIAKEQYPDSQELKLFEARVKDELAKKGISMDGSSTATTENSSAGKAE